MAARRELEEESFQVESTVRGHHIFKAIWTTVLGQNLDVQPERDNSFDAHAVATILKCYCGTPTT